MSGWWVVPSRKKRAESASSSKAMEAKSADRPSKSHDTSSKTTEAMSADRSSRSTWFPRGPYFREKCLFWNMGVPALEKSLLLNIFDRSREKSWVSIAVSKPGWSTSSCASWGFSKCCGNDVELFGNPSDPLTNHRWRVVWRHLVPAKIPRASFIKFYYVVTESQSADTWCHVVVVRNLIGPPSRRYTWHTLCKTSSIFVEIWQHT